jgi:hypothetical protein
MKKKVASLRPIAQRIGGWLVRGSVFQREYSEKRQLSVVFTAQFATKLVATNDAPTTHTRSVMGLKN